MITIFQLYPIEKILRYVSTIPKYNLRKTVSRALSSKLRKDTLTKKRKHNTWMGWVSPSSTRNYILNDLISDVLLRRKFSRNPITGKLDQKGSPHFLLEQGNEFERRVVKLMKRMFRSDECIDIRGNSLPRSYVLADKTQEAMSKGTPIIFAPVFHDFDKKWNGVPDLLIRSDYMSKLFANPPVIKESGCKWSDKWHYLIVDIKYSTLHLRSNGVEMLNEVNYKAYKAQLWMYNDMLARMQDYNPQRTYILGRNIKYSSAAIGDVVGKGCFDQAGVIDYEGWDKEYPSKVKKAINWQRYIPKIVDNFSIDTIIKNKKWNLYPNMCVTDMWVQDQKEQIAKQLNDITLLPYCGVKQREIAMSNGFTEWTDSRCCSTTLGFKEGSYRGRIVDACLQVNRPTSTKEIDVTPSNEFPSFIHLKDLKNKVYFDFETISNVCDDFSTLPQPSNMNLAFMVTFGYMSHGKFVIKTFTAQGLHIKFEKEMFEKSIKDIPIRNATFIHWGTHDKTVWEIMEGRYGIFCEPKVWFNAHRAYENDAFGIRGCFSSSLKKVTNALNDMGHVKQRYVKSEDGMEAMHRAYVAQQESEGEVFTAHPYIQELKEYNVKDVKALYEVTEFLMNQV